MTTATAPETATETVTFIAKCENQVLTRRQARHVDNGMGGKMVLTEQEWFERMREKGEPFDEAPWVVEFQNHIFASDNEKLTEWLRSHRLFNTPSGFYEQGHAPDEPQPTMAAQMERIGVAGAEADIEAVEDVLQIERDTHNRLPIIQSAEATLRKLREFDSEPGADGENRDNGDSTSTSQHSQPD